MHVPGYMNMPGHLAVRGAVVGVVTGVLEHDGAGGLAVVDQVGRERRRAVGVTAAAVGIVRRTARVLVGPGDTVARVDGDGVLLVAAARRVADDLNLVAIACRCRNRSH